MYFLLIPLEGIKSRPFTIYNRVFKKPMTLYFGQGAVRSSEGGISLVLSEIHRATNLYFTVVPALKYNTTKKIETWCSVVL